MMPAVCIVPVAPVRKFGNHAAEMTSQLLFGEYCTITETNKEGFAKIIIEADGYEGWCQLYHISQIKIRKQQQIMLAGKWVNEIVCNGIPMFIPFGSTLASKNAINKNAGNYIFKLKRKKTDIALLQPGSEAIHKIAVTFLNTPYLWGGRSVFGIDCSGFTQLVYKFFGIALLRDARQQATQGNTVHFLQQAQCGDLAFFDNEEGEIIHVGLLLSNSEIIHAAGKVQIDAIDGGGIISKSLGQRTHQLRIIKRYF